MNLRLEPRSILLFVAVLLSGVVLLLLVYWTLRAILLFYLAIVIAESLRPLVSRLTARRVPRPLAIALVYVAMAASLVILLSLIAVPLASQLASIARQLPENARTALGELLTTTGIAENQYILQQLESGASQLGGQLLGLSSFLITVPLAVFSIVVEFVLVIVISVYWLLASQSLGELILSVVPERYHSKTTEVVREMSYRVGSYIRGAAILIFAMGVMVYIILVVLRIPYAVTLAVFAGMAEVIPTFGPVIGAIPAVIIALFISPVKALILVGLYTVVQQIDSHVLAPIILGKAVGVHPLVVILAILFGGTLGGIAGALLAIPLAAMLEVLVELVILPALWARVQVG